MSYTKLTLHEYMCNKTSTLYEVFLFFIQSFFFATKFEHIDKAKSDVRYSCSSYDDDNGKISEAKNIKFSVV